jgi:predicted enzyme related to lactoylglutathione lyase
MAEGSYVKDMPFTHVFAGIPVADRDASVAWYEQLTGRPPDLIPNEQEAAWQLSEAGWIYIVAGETQAGSAVQTFLVDDLDGFLSEISARGISAGPVEVIGPGVRRTLIADPDGNRLKVGQPPT